MGEQRYKVGDWVRVKDNRGAPLDYKVGDVCQVSAVRDDLVFSNRKPGMFAKRFEPWQPRVGERVRYSGKSAVYSERELVGLEGKVTELNGNLVNVKWDKTIVDGIRTGGAKYIENLEPVLTTSTPEKPATLKIEAGKFYKTRDGRKVGPMARWSYSVEHPWEQQGGSSVFTKGGDIWRDDGTREYDVPPLITEWIDEPVAKPSNDNAKVSGMIQDFVGKTVTFKITQPKFNVGDRVKCLKSYPGQFTAGKEYVVAADHYGREYESVKVKRDDGGSTENGWLPAFFKLAPPTNSIVALIENGLPKPSSTPHVHASTGAAEKEAKRLAAKYKGKQFGVFTLTTTHEEAAPVYDHKWQNMAAMGLKIDAIKELRAVAGLDLLSAKRAVEAFEQAA